VQRLLQAKIVYASSPNLILSSFTQYDTHSRQVGVNNRLRWTICPEADLFVVWNRGWKHPVCDEEALCTAVRSVRGEAVLDLSAVTTGPRRWQNSPSSSDVLNQRLSNSPEDTFAQFDEVDGAENAFFDEVEKRKQRLDSLEQRIAEVTEEYRQAAKLDDAARRPPSDETLRLNADLFELTSTFTAELKQLQDYIGVPDEVFEEISAAKRPPREERYWRAEVEATPPSDDLDALAESGLRHLLDGVDRNWLETQARKPFRLGEEIFAVPMQLVGSVRVGAATDGPQRFAKMLLVTADHLAKHDRLDFFEAPMLVAEVAALGLRLDGVPNLGHEAIEKLRRLPLLTDGEVASTVYEFLVGTAARRKGLNVEMLQASKTGKTPDFRINDLAVPASIECKRRLGLLNYEMAEAEHVRNLYESIRPQLAKAHARVDVTFVHEVASVGVEDFAKLVLPLFDGGDQQATATWGTVAVEVLPYTKRLARTRVFAPNYMEAVFGWRPNEEWDGIVCEVEPTDSLVGERLRCPRAVRWVSRSEVALRKKARGVTSLWGDAMLQIPAGDMGFIYIAYSEVNRNGVADARTREIMDATARWTHRWSISLGTTVINRLYPRAVGVGNPDIIESAMPLSPNGDEFFVDLVPTCVFTHPAAGPSTEKYMTARARAEAMLIERAKRGK
jgi:hypothetical protein